MRLYGTPTLAAIALLCPSLARAQVDAGPAAAAVAAPSAAPSNDAGVAAAAPALPETPALQAHDAALRAQIEAETDAKIKKAQDQLRDEMRADMVTAGASAPSESEQIPPEKPKLQFLELNGYFRVRPNLYDDLWLGWTQPDKLGYYPFPQPYVNTTGKTILSSDMRFRIEPTFNVSEDIRLKAQIDVLDNVVLGSTPDGPYADLAAGAGGGLQPLSVFTNTQSAPTAAGNVYPNSITAKRIWAEVMTPVGQLRFGRMGNNWGLGLYQNDGNCLDCDFGNTVDRIMFIAKIANHYIIPMIDFVGAGPLYNPYAGDQLGQPIALDHDLEAYEYVLAIARKDTTEEMQRGWDEGKPSINYGFYGAYRNQSNDLIGYGDNAALASSATPTFNAATGELSNAPPGTIDATNANFFTPDLWFRYQTKRLRLEAEGVYSYGTFSTLFDPGSTTEHQITVSEFGGAAQGEYHFLSDGSLTVGVEFGLASGEDDPGFGNFPGRSVNAQGQPIETPAGAMDGRKFYCVNGVNPCPEDSINNFTFNQDYHVDMILWREIIGGVTGAWYARPNIKYTLIEGLDLSLSIIYSESWYAASTPGNQLPLGVEFDAGVHYKTDDGFIASIDYGLLVPLGGLGETLNDGTFLSPSVAQAIRVMLGVKY
jgi:uncharacterized protein (TIGR04551 family)